MKRLFASLLLVAALAGPAAADLDVTFETVDEVDRGYFRDSRQYELRIRGVPQGQTEPVQVRVRYGATTDYLRNEADACERKALLAASRPGRYWLQVQTQTVGRVEDLLSCRLTRR